MAYAPVPRVQRIMQCGSRGFLIKFRELTPHIFFKVLFDFLVMPPVISHRYCCRRESEKEGLSLFSSSEGTMNENTPVIIGRYRLSKTLGIGAFGKVKCESADFYFLPQ